MDSAHAVMESWVALPTGARIALAEQWAGLAAGGLPCGSAIMESGELVASGRNHAYDPAGPVESRLRYPLQHNRLAHAELNALACVPTEADHALLTLWSTQHPCAMCAAAIAFAGIGQVRFIADDPSDESPPAAILASRGNVSYRALGNPFWWTVSNLLFLYNSATQEVERARNIARNRYRLPELVNFTLDLSRHGALEEAARSGMPLPAALALHQPALKQVAGYAP